MKAHPVANTNAWIGPLIFTPDKIEAFVEAFNELELSLRMSLSLFFATSGAPSFTPVVFAQPYYAGSAAEGKAAFSSIYAVESFADQTAELPYNRVNAGGDGFCVKGGRKPAYSAGIAKLDPQNMAKHLERVLGIPQESGHWQQCNHC